MSLIRCATRCAAWKGCFGKTAAVFVFVVVHGDLQPGSYEALATLHGCVSSMKERRCTCGKCV